MHKKTYLTMALGLSLMVAAEGGIFASSSMNSITGGGFYAEKQVSQPVLREAVLKTQATGKVVYKNDKVVMDASNQSKGYIMVKYKGSNSKIKIQIKSPNGVTYTYNLDSRDKYEVFPLSEGNGSYSIKLFENVKGSSYSQAFSETISVKISNSLSPFLYPNQYVNFTSKSKVVSTAAKLVKGKKKDLDKVTAIYNYAVNNISYDYNKAKTVQSGYLPNVDNILKKKKGICFDYAAVMTSMLRSQNIPAKLVVGYTGNVYHAWINVYTKEKGWIDKAIAFDGNKWNLMDPTFASTGKGSKKTIKYINNTKNYKAKYTY